MKRKQIYIALGLSPHGEQSIARWGYCGFLSLQNNQERLFTFHFIIPNRAAVLAFIRHCLNLFTVVKMCFQANS